MDKSVQRINQKLVCFTSKYSLKLFPITRSGNWKVYFYLCNLLHIDSVFWRLITQNLICYYHVNKLVVASSLFLCCYGCVLSHAIFVCMLIHSVRLTGGNWQKRKRVFLTCPCHEIYRDEAVGLKIFKNTWKITIFVKMWNLGQYLENLIFCQ